MHELRFRLTCDQLAQIEPKGQQIAARYYGDTEHVLDHTSAHKEPGTSRWVVTFHYIGLPT